MLFWKKIKGLKKLLEGEGFVEAQEPEDVWFCTFYFWKNKKIKKQKIKKMAKLKPQARICLQLPELSFDPPKKVAKQNLKKQEFGTSLEKPLPLERRKSKQA